MTEFNLQSVIQKLRYSIPRFLAIIVALVLSSICAGRLEASFHVMQISQVIGGVNGDASAQAIELRMRAPGQNFLSNAPKLVVVDATGSNPITLITFGADVAQGNLGSTILVSTSGFKNHTANPAAFKNDFTLTHAIPAAYLNAGRLLYEDFFGNILWSLAFGGAAYTGPTNGETTNGVADPGKFAGPLPKNTLQALRYKGTASGANNNNAIDYALTAGAATFTNNAGTSFTVVAQPPIPSRLLNISTRARVLSGDNVLIGGTIITGGGVKKVILRGIGPSLAAAGIQGPLADPVLELHKPGGIVITNDNWKTTQRAEIQATGVAPTNDNESAIVATLTAGNYTAILRGKNNSTGIGLVEAYDLNPTAVTQLVNISSRGLVGTKDDVLIGGIIVGLTGAANSRLLVLAIGPSLVSSKIANPLLDPTLELHNKNGVLIASNNDWKDKQRAAIQATGAAPTDDRESAILFTVAPGNYTAIVRGRNATTGVALVEVFNLH
jgi:co-chaperonin GroES (HSP10)